MLVVQVELRRAGALGTAGRFAVEQLVGDRWVRSREVLAYPGTEAGVRQLLLEGNERLVVEAVVNARVEYWPEQMANVMVGARQQYELPFGSGGQLPGEAEPILDVSQPPRSGPPEGR